jgi:hypothetical protein
MAFSIKHAAASALLMICSFTGQSMGQSRSAAGPVVVELFTSQGCSSCPPADELLGELASLPNVVALAFHVDYWDNIGWRDRFSIAEAMPRQRRYVEALGLSSAFTPQMVIDGRGSFVGSDRRRIVAALAERADKIAIAAEVANGLLEIKLRQHEDRIRYEVNLVAFLPQASTAIVHGENSGRRVTEFNIVRQFRRLGVWEGQEAVMRVRLDSFPADATRVAVLLQRLGQGPIGGSAIAALR